MFFFPSSLRELTQNSVQQLFQPFFTMLGYKCRVRSSCRGYRASKTNVCLPFHEIFIVEKFHRTKMCLRTKCPRAVFTDSLLSETTETNRDNFHDLSESDLYYIHISRWDGTRRTEEEKDGNGETSLRPDPSARSLHVSSRDRSPVSIEARDHLMDLLTWDEITMRRTKRSVTQARSSRSVYRARMRITYISARTDRLSRR